jgi:hypothetical protein
LYFFISKSCIAGPVWKVTAVTFHIGPLTDYLEEKKYNLSHIHLIPPDDGLQIGPKHVEAR